MQLPKVSGEPWCVNYSVIFGGLSQKKKDKFMKIGSMTNELGFEIIHGLSR